MKQKIARYFGLQNKPSSGATKVETTFVPSTFVAPGEGLFCKPKYRAIFCFIHFFALRISSSVSSFLQLP